MNTLDLTIEESGASVYPLYVEYIAAFQADGGPVRPILDRDAFTQWWNERLTIVERAEYSLRFASGYQPLSEQKVREGAELIRTLLVA